MANATTTPNRYTIVGNPQVDEVTQQVLDGTMPLKAALHTLGMGYSKFWNHYASVRLAQQPSLALKATPAAIAAARNKGDEYSSWGWVMVRANVTEGQARKLYTQHTNIDSVGTRNGHGGRFAGDEGHLYLGPAKATGPMFAAGTHNPTVQAETPKPKQRPRKRAAKPKATK